MCGDFQVGFTSEGRITAVDINLYNNGGMSLDLSGAVSFYLQVFVVWSGKLYWYHF